MSTRCNTAANELVPQTDPEAMIRQANAEKRRIKANIEQHLLGLATGTIKPPSDSFDPDFLTSKSFLTNTSNTPTDQLDTTQTLTSSSSPVNPTRHPMPPQPTLNPQDPPSPFLQRTMSGKNMETGGIPVNKTDAGDQKMVPPLTTMEYLNALLATQQATLAQAQADREEYARQDADAAACLAESASRNARLEEAMIGMTIKSQTPERRSHSPSDDVNLRSFRTSDGPAYTRPYQEIIISGSLIKEPNLLGFFATDSKTLVEGSWDDFKNSLMKAALPFRWRTTIRKQLRFLTISPSESFHQFVARGRSLQQMINFGSVVVSNKDLAEGLTFGIGETVEANIYKHRILDKNPFDFNEFVTRAADCFNTSPKLPHGTRGTTHSTSASPQTLSLSQENYVWRIHAYLDSVGKCHFCKQHCGSAAGACSGPVDKQKVPIPPSFVAPPKPASKDWLSASQLIWDVLIQLKLGWLDPIQLASDPTSVGGSPKIL
ncbi:hypothetical protein PSTT_04756 [Puccinia striiformis]|uniref:Uncharacterized protein n=1 Tax=Puccinia striiformis TaxID=27350 RepID=A0A2S4VRK1_9BASI|nr:hypothetical protein PSTT_04756 [Puccinia striiformis]